MKKALIIIVVAVAVLSLGLLGFFTLENSTERQVKKFQEYDAMMDLAMADYQKAVKDLRAEYGEDIVYINPYSMKPTINEEMRIKVDPNFQDERFMNVTVYYNVFSDFKKEQRDYYYDEMKDEARAQVNFKYL